MKSDQYRGLIIGVGTEYGDDAFGLLVARHLAGRTFDGIDVITHSGEGASLMEAWQGYDSVVIVDASQSGAPVGTKYRFDASVERIPTRTFRYSTHAFGVAEAVETARALKRLPRRMIVIGVEGESFQPGASIDPRLEPLVREVAAQALAEIGADVFSERT